jgi:Tol biopolymer transport system component
MQGEIVPLSESPELTPRIIGAAGFDAAADGTIVYDEVDRRPTDAIWLSRDGRPQGKLFRTPKASLLPEISPRGDYAAILDREGVDASVSVVDLATGSMTRVLRPEREPRGYAWSPVDGRLVTTLGQWMQTTLVSITPDGGDERSVGSLGNTFLTSLSVGPDGTLLLRRLVSGGTDLVYLRQGKGTELEPYLVTPANEWIGLISPDGRWIAYSSDASGRYELYVDAFPQRREARRVSNGGVSSYAAWRGDGGELFYIAGDGRSVMACDVRTSPALAIGAPHLLHELPDVRGWAPMPSGDKFLVLQAVGERRSSLTLVQNWSEQLRK